MSTSSNMHKPVSIVATDCVSANGERYVRIEIADDNRTEFTFYTDRDFVETMVKALLFRERKDFRK